MINVFQKVKEKILKYKRSKTVIASDTIKRNASEEIQDLYEKLNLDILSLDEIDELSHIAEDAYAINKMYKDYISNIRRLESIKKVIEDLEYDSSITIKEINYKYTSTESLYDSLNVPGAGVGVVSIITDGDKLDPKDNKTYKECIINIFKLKYIITLKDMSKSTQEIRKMIESK